MEQEKKDKEKPKGKAGENLTKNQKKKNTKKKLKEEHKRSQSDIVIPEPRVEPKRVNVQRYKPIILSF